MYGNKAGGEKWQPIPKTAGEWTDHWTQDRKMIIPGRSGRQTLVDLADVAPVPPGSVPGDPDLLMTIERGRRFYLKFPRVQVAQALDIPLLVYPPERGANGALWILPAPAATR